MHGAVYFVVHFCSTWSLHGDDLLDEQEAEAYSAQKDFFNKN